MPRIKTFTASANSSAHPEKGGRSRNRVWPKPDEGLRLMHAFLDIEQPEVREAVIKYVEEQSRLQKRSLAVPHSAATKAEALRLWQWESRTREARALSFPCSPGCPLAARACGVRAAFAVGLAPCLRPSDAGDDEIGFAPKRRLARIRPPATAAEPTSSSPTG